jgi:hypothetical protein
MLLLAISNVNETRLSLWCHLWKKCILIQVNVLIRNEFSVTGRPSSLHQTWKGNLRGSVDYIAVLPCTTELLPAAFLSGETPVRLQPIPAPSVAIDNPSLRRTKDVALQCHVTGSWNPVRGLITANLREHISHCFGYDLKLPYRDRSEREMKVNRYCENYRS